MVAHSESMVTPKALANLKPFKPGQSGNPGGKPVGARNRLNAAFLNALAAEFETNGKKAIKAVAKEDPSTFMRVLAGILPKEVELTKQMDEVTDEQLDAAAVAIRAILAAQDSGAAASKAKKPKSTV